MRRIAPWVALALAVLGPAPARAQPRVVTAVAIRYVPDVVEIEEGERLTFVNADPLSLTDGHNVTEFAAVPRFLSDTVLVGFTADVRGVASMPPGEYAFYCTLHPTMRGVLRVVVAY